MRSLTENPEPVRRRPFAFCEGLGAALLVGGLVATAIVAMLAFRSPEILTRDQAGRFNAKLFGIWVYVEGAGLALVALGQLSRRGGALARRLGLGAIAVALVAHLGIGARMTQIREQAGGSMAMIPADDARHGDFRRLHGIYEAASLFMLLGGLFVLIGQAKAED